MKNIRVAIIGVGNCASSLLQGVEYYKDKTEESAIGLMHWKIGGYSASDIEISAAFDIDQRKVGKDIAEAIFEKPNCTAVFCENVPKTGTIVQMGNVLDGFSEHMRKYDDDETFLLSAEKQLTKEEVIKVLKDSNTSIVMNYLPVGSEQAVRFYAECALEAGCAFINNMPVFIASDPVWAKKFEEKNLPIIGDDIKAQLGATITHRTLMDLFRKRGVAVDRTYQINTGGNTDFLNMLNRNRLASKKISKTESVQSVAGKRLEKNNVHIGPSDYVPWQNDNKVAFIRIEGRLFGDVPMNIEMRLSVEDSPNSAGVAIDSIRCAQVALDRKIGGILHGPSSFFMKHPPIQVTDDEAYQQTEEFIRKN
jgi:myo-inositol-1-phosphate synthase